MPGPNPLAVATEAEKAAYTWVRRRRLTYLEDYLFWPLLLGGIPLGYISVNFYFRPGVVLATPLGWRVRPEPSGNERETEARLITMQQESSTVRITRVNDQDVLTRLQRTLREAIAGRELV